MSNYSLEHALVLVSQGKSREAQNLLKPLITADPHNIAAWFLLVETLPSNHLRLKALEHCLTHNPDNLQVRKSLEELQGTIKEEPTVLSIKEEVFASTRSPEEQNQKSNKAYYSDQDLAKLDASSKKVAENPLPTRKTLIAKKLKWFAILIAAIIGSIAVRLLAPGFFLIFFGCLLLIPIGIHFAVHLFVILRADIDSPAFDKIILASNLLLFFWFLTQTDFDDSNSASALTQVFAAIGIHIPWAIKNFLSYLSYVLAIGLIISWLAAGVPWFHISRERRRA